ncbi:MAG: hypothetical protein J5787_05145 [Alphaproteobacteria bacterium]|nr:hypothetical protein [Alphaproteobacteria bacterium]
MSVAQQIDQFFQSTGQSVFIEAEAKESRILSFIRDYNSKYSLNLRISDEGIISLGEDANKWGLELRCYFIDRTGIPAGVQVTSNRAYRAEYPYRFNDVDVIQELFDLGYRIGLN